jgi:leucyl/phenylalanyl-tRNA--protein transferase
MDLQDPTPDLLISAYTRGVFPMADARTGELVWLSPDPRAILPLDELRVSRSLARVVRSGRFEIRTDTAFELVMRACAESRPDRDETWIDDRLIRAYTALHALGLAHSVEAWREGELVGGLYGVQVGAAFCGESMFHRPELGGTDASKVCLVRLVEWLRAGSFQLLDVQFMTPHLARLGCVEISREAYLERLGRALRRWGDWPAPGVQLLPGATDV